MLHAKLLPPEAGVSMRKATVGMHRNGFESDAAYFDLVATSQQDPQVRRELQELASTYRALAKNNGELIRGTREQQWIKRAEECRTLADRFQSQECRAYLHRLADTYDMLAGAGDLGALL